MYETTNQDYSKCLLQKHLDRLNKKLKSKRFEIKKSIVEKIKHDKNNIESYNILTSELKLLIEQKILIEKQMRKISVY